MLCYCKKCGRIVLIILDDNLICDCCGSNVNQIPTQYLEPEFQYSIKDELKDQFIEEYVKTSPEFDQYLFDHRDEILAKKNLEYDMAIAHGQAILEGKDKGNPYGVSCPNCKATNVRKITVTNKAIHTSIFGIWSMGRNAKNYHCNNCGSDF